MAQPTQRLDLSLIPNADGSLDSLFPMGNKSEVGLLVASYNFNAGDNTHTVKNGFAFEGNSDVVVSIPGESEMGVPFTFTGIGNDLITETIFERYYSFTQQTEAWFHQRFYVPPNYKHRRIHVVTVTGDMASWQIGDTVATVNGSIPGSTGIIYGISDSELKLEFSQNPYSSIWGTVGSPTTITNITRSQNATSVHYAWWPNNNKLFVMYCDAYSFHGQNPTIIFETHSVDGVHSSAYMHHATDFQVAVPEIGEFTDFITAGQIGKFIDIFYGIKLASAVGVSDGVVEMWIKREGESSYTRKMNATGLPIWKRAGNTVGLSNGYLHGPQNSGYYETTVLYDTMIELYTSKPGYLI